MDNLPIDYNHTFFEVKQKINKDRYETLKAINKEQILAYLEIGKIITN